ncbi:unnamed protein product [Ambrosiozyma monospora]|uniref:Unnamed protein product n=1 Tax=Ambrosiozyma monospora TaxID=43982 RepID=A0ACB5STB3_AMBMO|nr:unnamed protein product [Ambrosiozyma monospora]
MSRLKRLLLAGCQLIGPDFFNSISEICCELGLSKCEYYDTDSIVLPTSLRLLNINGDLSTTNEFQFPKISSLGKLKKLSFVEIQLNLPIDLKITDEQNMLSICWIETFIAQLPSSLESFFLDVRKGESDISGNAAFHPEELEFDDLTNLHTLHLKMDSDPTSIIPLNLSNLPRSLRKT